MESKTFQQLSVLVGSISAFGGLIALLTIFHFDAKSDISDLRTGISDLRKEIKGDLFDLRKELKGDISAFRQEVILWQTKSDERFSTHLEQHPKVCWTENQLE